MFFWKLPELPFGIKKGESSLFSENGKGQEDVGNPV
ncbi:hypothetical protein EVA_08339 [gut metagenome]|uniref:Uncharacterized protein n=1 Tax=gut metagenome TaxID=749906 RepID=J9GTD2_9ZZZZ